MVCLMLGEIGEVDMFRHLASVPIVEPQRPKNEWFIQCARVDRLGERNPSVVFLGLGTLSADKSLSSVSLRPLNVESMPSIRSR